MALLLTLVRADYLALALGVLGYFICCSNRRQLVGIGGMLAVLVIVASAGLSVFYGGSSGESTIA